MHTSSRIDKSHDLILWLFDYRCINCTRPTRAVHEIIPRSHGKNSMMIKNRVPLCHECHIPWAHGKGTNNSIPILQRKRREFLVRKFEL
jgi:5-methylcytosine-specific restriction endonuclease McrA